MTAKAHAGGFGFPYWIRYACFSLWHYVTITEQQKGF
jgi:hypothetical protein